MAYPRKDRREQRITGVLSAVFLSIVGGAAVLYLLLRLLPSGGPNLPGAPPPPRPAEILSPPTPTPAPGVPVAQPTPSAAPTPIGPRPAVDDFAQRWVQAFQARRYADLYEMLSKKAKASIPRDKFVGRYDQVFGGVNVVEIKATLPPVRDPPPTVASVDARFDAHFRTGRYGEWDEHYTIPFVYEDNAWKVDWTPDLIFKDLAPDRSVRVFDDDPTRGNIVDKNGVPLAQQQRVPALGVIPGQLKDKAGTINALAQYLQIDPKVIQQKIDGAQAGWWVPLGVFPPDKRPELQAKFGNVPGVVLDEKDTRVYPQGEVAANVVGYTTPATADDLKTLSAKGYEGGEAVGRAGVEASMDDQLAGQPGGRLIIADPGGNTIRTISQKQAKQGQTVQLTIDVNVQKKVEAILGNQVGSMVLMDPRDNSVMAMVTYPRFDPNIFVFGISPDDWNKLNNDPRHVFLNRPTMASYPTGSIFKPITMIAGLERGGFNADTRIHCSPTWQLPGSNVVMKNWETIDRGMLSLPMGITTSCNPVWYTVGYKLWQTDPDLLASFAKQFGLGQPTGVGIAEVPGIVPSNEWKQKALGQPLYPGDVVNFAIGQGYFEATPLQMANVYTTIARRGELKTPLLISKVGPIQGSEPPKVFQAQTKGHIQASPNTWQLLKEGMLGASQNPIGTAYYAMSGYRIPVASKTGSAENENPDAHAWYAGYAPADNPQVVVIAMVEGGKMGGVVAAPLGRKAYEAILGQ